MKLHYDSWQDKSIDYEVIAKAPTMWDIVNLKDDPVAFIQRMCPYDEFTFQEFQKQFLQQIADTCGVPRKYLK